MTWTCICILSLDTCKTDNKIRQKNVSQFKKYKNDYTCKKNSTILCEMTMLASKEHVITLGTAFEIPVMAGVQRSFWHAIETACSLSISGWAAAEVLAPGRRLPPHSGAASPHFRCLLPFARNLTKCISLSERELQPGSSGSMSAPGTRVGAGVQRCSSVAGTVTPHRAPTR
jgi:hypothetical protein